MIEIDAKPSALPTYVYKRLDPSSSSTRLVELLPGGYDETIRLKMHTVVLAESSRSENAKLTFTVEDIQKELPQDWKVRETINGRFIFERIKLYGPEEPYENSWTHPRAGFEPISNEYGHSHARPRYEALSHAWGLDHDLTPIEILDVGFPDVKTSVSGETQNVINTSGAHDRKRKAEEDLEYGDSRRDRVISLRETPAHTLREVRANSTQSLPAVMWIRADLVTALRHLRASNRSRMLWVDNICIDQNDVHERNRLVKMMGEIYKHAERVIVWVGPAQADSDLAMSTLDLLGRQVELTNHGSWRVNSPGCLHPTWSRTAVALPYDGRTWKAIGHLIDRKWFERLWVWQEAKLSSDDSYLQCGHKKLDLYRFTAAVWCAAAKTRSTPRSLQEPLLKAGKATFRQSIEPFLNTLLHLNPRKCFDPRDKVYGALGLAPREIIDSIMPDYVKEVEQVYADTANVLVAITSRLDFLVACDISDRSFSWPTWAPDWSRARRLPPKWVLSMTLASGVSIATSEILYTPKPTLLVQGVRCGVVSRVGDRVPLFGTPVEINAVVRSWAPADLKDARYMATEEPLLEAFARTLHWNILRDRCPLDHSVPSLKEAVIAVSDACLSDQTTFTGSEMGSTGLEIVHQYGVLDRHYIELDNGRIGLTSADVEVTDLVCVILGCQLPMILRPLSSGRYQVVGPAYVHGIMDGESLLGPLDCPYVIERSAFEEWHGGCVFRNTDTNEVIVDDPRLGSIPASWIRVSAVRTPIDPPRFVRFRDLATGRSINGDPRLLSETLRARGVLLEPLKLV